MVVVVVMEVQKQVYRHLRQLGETGSNGRGKHLIFKSLGAGNL
jgi:hypothetical protein